MTVDVIVPIIAAAHSARRCIESLLATPQSTPFGIIVVNDASPDASTVSWLRTLAEQRRIALVEQPMPQGLAAALNRAVALHRGLDRDVAIVSADTEVCGDWLDRLARHASHGDVGTVVPFASSGASIGYPRSDRANAMPRGQSLAMLDSAFQRANAAAGVALPLAFGPCIYVRRECLNAIGAFSAGPNAADEGVLEDFSLRASNAGFRHVLAADCYVWRDDPGAPRTRWSACGRRSTSATHRAASRVPSSRSWTRRDRLLAASTCCVSPNHRAS